MVSFDFVVGLVALGRTRANKFVLFESFFISIFSSVVFDNSKDISFILSLLFGCLCTSYVPPLK